MMRPQLIFKSFLVCLLCQVFVAKGHTNAQQFLQPNKLLWHQITQEQYMENLVSCQIALSEYKWSKTLWPKENKNPKPAFSDVIDLDSIIKRVELNIKKQKLLKNRFNQNVSTQLLQSDLNRMVNNTKDPNRLQEIFALLGHDPHSVALCVSRPHLVDSIFAKKYYWDGEIHNKTKEIAHKELAKYFAGDELAESDSHISSITYQLESFDEPQRQSSRENRYVIELSEKDYQEKLQQAQTKHLIEKDNFFVYNDLIEQNDGSFTVRSLTWHKVPEGQWLQKQSEEHLLLEVPDETLKLPKAKTSYQKSGTNPPIQADSWRQNNSHAPRKRTLHSAVWTGTEMIVWGGYLDYTSDFLNSGGRYNPTTDTWTPTNFLGAPVGRADHAAIWTGTEMIVWGGHDGNDFINSGAIYNPNGDTWSTMSDTGSPVGKNRFTAVWTGEKMIVWGGSNVDELDNDVYFNTGSIYSPDLDVWSKVNQDSNTPVGRRNHSAVWTGTHMIVWGGYNGSTLATGAKYNPKTRQWSEVNEGDAPPPRSGHSAIWSGSEMIIWGGTRAQTGARYSPDDDSWVDISTLDSPRTGSIRHEALWTGTELLIWVDHNTAGIYTPSTDSWRTISESPLSSKYDSTAVWTGTEMIVWGGASEFIIGRGYITTNEGARYNPATDEWLETMIINGPDGSFKQTVVWTGYEMIFWGGSQYGYRYNPALDNWLEIATGNPRGIFRHSAVWTGTEMIVWGGESQSIDYNTGGRYNPLNDSWTPTSTTNAPSYRARHSAVWTGSDMIIWGGLETDGIVNTGGIYHPESDSWSATPTSDAPTGRYGHTAIWTGNEMIIWGGIRNGGSETGSRYNPSTNRWTDTNNEGAPSDRRSHKAIWTGSEMILWGGSYGRIRYNTGGRYHPPSDSWSPISIFDSPSGRTGHSMVLTDEEIIIWGGYDGKNRLNTGARYNILEDTWMPTDIDTAPPERNLHQAVWTGREMLVWGGFNAEDNRPLEIYYPYSFDFIYADGFENE